MRKDHKNVSMLYIANWFIFVFIVILALSMFQNSSTSGIIMLICAAFCSPFVSKKLLESGKFSKSLLFVSQASLFLILWILAVAVGTPKVEAVPEQVIVETETVDEKIIAMVSERSELKDTTAGNIMKYFVEHNAPNLGGYIERDEETSPIIGKDGLVSKVGFFITTAENVDADDPFCGTIEAFENKESAKNKYQLLKGYFKDGLAKSEYMYLKDCVLMRIKTDVPLEDERKYERLLDKYMLNEYMEENFMLENITEPATETEPETIPETTETATEADTEPETTIPETESPTEPPTEAKKQVGKDIDKIETFSYRGDVRNDTTGNWRYAVLAEYGVNVAEYAVSYYDKYMSGSDTEIHAVVNLLDRTTTKIVQAIAPDELALTVYSYVDGEEHDAKLMFGGNVIAYYTVNKETGEITEE